MIFKNIDKCPLAHFNEQSKEEHMPQMSITPACKNIVMCHIDSVISAYISLHIHHCIYSYAHKYMTNAMS